MAGGGTTRSLTGSTLAHAGHGVSLACAELFLLASARHIRTGGSCHIAPQSVYRMAPCPFSGHNLHPTDERKSQTNWRGGVTPLTRRTMAKISKKLRAKIGSLGGKAATHKGITSPAKKRAAKRNGRMGGRPIGTRGPNACTKYPSHRFNPEGICYGCRYKRPKNANRRRRHS